MNQDQLRYATGICGNAERNILTNITTNQYAADQQACSRSQMDEAINVLRESSTHLVSQLEKLQERLSKVLSPKTACAGGALSENVASAPLRAPLANDLYEIAGILQAGIDIQRDLHARLEA